MVKICIFIGMPTILNSQKGNSFEICWPLCKDLPPLVNKSLFSTLPQELFNLNFLVKKNNFISNQKQEKPEDSQSFKIRKAKTNTNCPHKDLKHYAKNMCSDCYSKILKANKQTACGHADKAFFARNLCLQCYTKEYRASKKERLS